MAREEQTREDLLAEAKNLVERVSLQFSPPLGIEETVAGFRRDGSLAIFLGQQRVYQFTSAGDLRRAYVDGLLYKAQAGKLVSMRRERTLEAVNLVSVPLNELAKCEFFSEMQAWLDQLKRATERGQYSVLGQVPPDAAVIERVLAWLTAHSGRIAIANSPRSV